MNKKSDCQSLADVFDRWRIEDRELAEYVKQVRDWMTEVEQLGIPHFGETATRLRPLRDRLVQHFQREEEMISNLAAALPEPSTEFDLLRTNAAHDHELLLVRLDDLSARLSETDPQFESWQVAMNEVATLVHQLQEHERMEANTIEQFLAKMNIKSPTRYP